MAWLIPSKKSRAATGLQETAPVYYRMVDTPQLSYAQWREESGDTIATFSAPPAGKVAIVGAGLGGLAAAYELLKCGVDVTVYEATERSGGRLYSKKFNDTSPDIAELGAMRFPPSEELLYRYLDLFGIGLVDDFPDPGKVPTYVAYKSSKYPPGTSFPPAEFDTVNAGWNALMNNGATITYVDSAGNTQTKTLVAPAAIQKALQTDASGTSLNPDVDVETAWSDWLSVFANRSLINGLVLIFSSEANLPEGATLWSYPEDYERFASLGTGFGGFGPLYQVAFLEIIRLVVNGLETDQKFVPSGIESLADSLRDTTITQPGGGTTTVGDNLNLNSPISGIYRFGDKIAVLGGDGTPVPAGPFDQVIVATTQRSMEIDTNLGLFYGIELNGNTYGPTQEAETAQALRDIHIMNSSKVFIRTATQFWKEGTNVPRCILSDSLSANLYTLDYGATSGVVLISYVWGDQSIKQISFQDKQARVELLRDAIAAFDLDFAAELVPAGGDYENNVQMIDWELQPHFYGAFKLSRPSQDHYVQQVFYDYQKVSGGGANVFLAGDSVSWIGGWTEGALQTSMNAACAVAEALGGTLNTPVNPLTALQANTYNYNVTNA
ncbi:FAD-dependent oxidoreductase [Nisaea acidiphila]|uniref:Tryptophan 2-monooxygenase n=1 Tax=Nisaea acidiphila TaxID=1862145 RepID=A0A9J7AWJ9_9PROT|nr:NAD(P)/FAD-dependent oxidoreductase [Nisaea acidiphila]UUX51170.1 FAD-dependent oxidoreductase [Nisaea acidiphila]